MLSIFGPVCAYAWLAGEKRFVARSSYIAFHASYELNSEQAAHTTGAGNAILGAYLNRLGLSYDAIFYMTKPEQENEKLQWFTIEDAGRLGISIVVMEDAAPKSMDGGRSAKSATEPAKELPVLHVHRRAHPEWKILAQGSREFVEIQQSCAAYPADQVSTCWYIERESYDWAMKNKFPAKHEKRLACWNAASRGPALRFKAYKDCVQQ